MNGDVVDLEVYEPDWMLSDCYFVLQKTTGWHSIQFIFWKEKI